MLAEVTIQMGNHLINAVPCLALWKFSSLLVVKKISALIATTLEVVIYEVH
jgi:hypothetical protein